MNVTYIGASWPQPATTAAGHRTMGLLTCLLNLGYHITFLTYKKPNPSQMTSISRLPLPTHYCPPNQPSLFSSLTSPTPPNYCIFERFPTEEMFSHLVHTLYPDCIRILDTQDLHCLRTQRESMHPSSSITTVKSHVPCLMKDENACREFASIHRSDLVVFSSDYEAELVRKHMNIEHFVVLPMFYPLKEIRKWKEMETKEKKDMVWLGNFTHSPNKDSLEVVKKVWPRVKKELPEVKLDVYGAFFPKGFGMEGEGIEIKGQVGSVECLQRYRVMLAPIRFGAGIKGKITDGWMYGVVPVTTSIGAEGLSRNGFFPGFIQDDWSSFSATAVSAYQADLSSTRNDAWSHLCTYFSLETNQALLQHTLHSLQLPSFRPSRHLQHLLWSQSLRSTEYLSKYLQLKSKHY